MIEGIHALIGGEGPSNRPIKMGSPQVLVAGLNPVCTDAAAMAVMGFDPMAARAALESSSGYVFGTRKPSRAGFPGGGTFMTLQTS